MVITVIQKAIRVRSSSPQAGLVVSAGWRECSPASGISCYQLAMTKKKQKKEAVKAAWTPDRVRSLGMTTDVATAAEIMGIGRTLAFDLLKRDEFPVRTIRVSRRVLVPVGDLLKMLE